MTDQAQAITQARIDIATLEVQVEHLSKGMEALQESNQQMQGKLDQVLLTLSEARGGWRTLMLMGGAGTSVGAGLAWLISHLGK